MSANPKLRPRRNFKGIAIAALSVMATAGVVYAVWFSPLFKIQSISVSGIDYPGDDVLYAPSKNILFWRPPDVISDSPDIASFTTAKDFPNRSVSITAVRREKFLIWCMTKQDNCFWVDGNGFVFGEAPDPSGSLLVHAIRDDSDRAIKIGDTILDSNMFGNVARMYSLLDKVGVVAEDVRIENLDFKEVVVYLSGGPKILVSLLVNPEFGEGVLISLKNSGEWSKIRYIDLRVENRAYYSL